MLSASSPITFPASSSPPGAKRTRPQHEEPVRSRPKVQSGFVIEDDSDSDEESIAQPPLKKQMLENSKGNTVPELPVPFKLPVQEAHLPKNLSHGISSVVEQQNTLPSDVVIPPSQYQPIFASIPSYKPPRTYTMSSCTGKSCDVNIRKPTTNDSYESMVAARSKTKEGRAKRSYYGIEINELVDAAAKEMAEKASQTITEPDLPVQSVETGKKHKKSLLWTEKYRAKNFMDLCGDDGTNRMVLRWLKRWDPMVFPGAAKKPTALRRPGSKLQIEEEKPHKKILMLTGPPGLGKTTLAHVCARQAGYDVMEINASDDRSRNVVNGRIRTSLGTESVKTVSNKKTKEGERQKVARPACIIVDEVDGVVAGSGASGEGGFIKALIDLVLLDQKNASGPDSSTESNARRRKKKGDDFRLMRPLILICNDVYHPSLRPLRQSNLAEVIHVGRPGIDAVVTRLKTVFDKEGIPCEKDAARKICEAAWGMTSGIDAKRGAESGAEGDLRGVMVVGEWVAGRYRSTAPTADALLTRQWLETHVLRDLTHGAGGARGLGRGGVKDIVSRVFKEGGGFPKQGLDFSQSSKTQHEQPKAQLSFAEHHKKYAMDRLRQMVDTSGDIDRIMTDIFLEYPNREFNDDSFLTKPNDAYDWMHFLDTCSSRIYSNQDWELGAYLSQPVLACHSLFASPHKHFESAGYDKKWGANADGEDAPPLPFSGPRADYAAYEAEKQNRAILQALHSQLNPTLSRSFRGVEDIATDFLPYLIRLVSPDVKPVVVGGSGDQKGTASVRKEAEKNMVNRAAAVLVDIGVELQRGKIESDSIVDRAPQWVYRMEPDLDALASFETAGSMVLVSQAPTRYAVRQVLDQEVQKTIALRENAARQARFKAGNLLGHDDFIFHDDKENLKPKLNKQQLLASSVKKDFFGRVIEVRPLQEMDGNTGEGRTKNGGDGRKNDAMAWITFHEGLNNAVKKPISLPEFLRCL